MLIYLSKKKSKWTGGSGNLEIVEKNIKEKVISFLPNKKTWKVHLSNMPEQNGPWV